MRAPHSRFCRRRRLVWLLSFVLLLPLAQTATTWHAFSLPAVDGGTLDGKHPYHRSHCDFCLTAAALTAGALTGEPPTTPPATARHELAPAVSSGTLFAPIAWAYRSRAPPIAAR